LEDAWASSSPFSGIEIGSGAGGPFIEELEDLDMLLGLIELEPWNDRTRERKGSQFIHFLDYGLSAIPRAHLCMVSIFAPCSLAWACTFVPIGISYLSAGGKAHPIKALVWKVGERGF
jgi:hypothetical protein